MTNHLTDSMQKRLLIDFDGTVAQYNGWQGNDKIGEPVKGVHAAFKELQQAGFNNYIHSTRAMTNEGITAIILWLKKNDLWHHVKGITPFKLGAFCYPDDRAIKFDGNWPLMLHKISTFKAWGEK